MPEKERMERDLELFPGYYVTSGKPSSNLMCLKDAGIIYLGPHVYRIFSYLLDLSRLFHGVL
jgi:hypothetical protein